MSARMLQFAHEVAMLRITSPHMTMREMAEELGISFGYIKKIMNSDEYRNICQKLLGESTKLIVSQTVAMAFNTMLEILQSDDDKRYDYALDIIRTLSKNNSLQINIGVDSVDNSTKIPTIQIPIYSPDDALADGDSIKDDDSD